MNNEFKSCPFCGDPMHNDGETFGHTDSNLPCIIAKQAWGSTERAIASWNTRVKGHSAPVEGDVERHPSEDEVERLIPALEQAWTDFLDANPDGLTSPPDLPDHALVTCGQMVGIACSALAEVRAALASSATNREER